MILGLDLSTSIAGVCVLNLKDEIELVDAIDLRNKNKYTDIFEKEQYVYDYLLKLRKNNNITKIVIEKKNLSFKKGFSSAKTLSVASSFNGVVSWMCYQIFNIKPTYIFSTSARKKVGIKIPKKSDSKKVVLQYMIDNNFLDVELTHKGNPKPKFYDMADAIVIAKSYLSS